MDELDVLVYMKMKLFRIVVEKQNLKEYLLACLVANR